MRVAIVNYGMGNLGSVRRAFDDVGADAFIAEHPAALYDAHRVVLPGVGAFGEGMSRLHAAGWVDALQRLAAEGSRPLLGICLGMQMLASEGEEGGASRGLDLIPGRIRRLDALGCTMRVPHVGWNEIGFDESDPLFAHIPQRADFYFVHSYAFVAAAESWVNGVTDYGIPVVASVRRGTVFGTQFHPEKSSKAGRQLLRNFLDFKPC
jgi:glutamine amidotransferase